MLTSYNTQNAIWKFLFLSAVLWYVIDAKTFETLLGSLMEVIEYHELLGILSKVMNKIGMAQTEDTFSQ